ncbi:MAG: TonB-dependent receptor plug domain-containing protein [Vicinamibacteria bacterium]
MADLPDMTIEQLLDVPLVSVASRRAQRTDEAPSIVTVVSGDEIRRHGYRTLADVLRTLPGFYVSYDRNYSYVGVRGFGRPGDYNTRVLLLIDGVRMNDNIFDGAYVGEVLPVDAQVIERVEVSRGPGGAVYGNNAFFAVVNVVTRRGAQLAGGELEAGASSFGAYEGRASYGRELGRDADVAVSGSISASEGQSLYFPEFAATNGGGVRGGDGERSHKAFASFSKGGFLAEALASSRTKHIPTASYGTVFGDTRALTRDAFTSASLAYERPLGARFDWSSRLAFVAYDYEGTYPFELEPGEVSLYRDFGRGRWWSADSTGVLSAGRHMLVLGGELTRNARQDQGGGYAGQPETEFEILDQGVRYGAFVQDDVTLGKRVRLSVGGRYDHHEDFGGEANPRFALIVRPESRTTVKLLYGSSYRAPNEYEQNYFPAQRRTSRALRPEGIRTVEAAAERRFGARFVVSASVFANDLDDLITLESNAAGELVFANTGRARSRGGEAAIEARLGSGATTRLSYSYQRTKDGGDRQLSNSPVHTLKGDFSAPLWNQSTWLSGDAQYVSSRLTLAGANAPGFVLVNAVVVTRLRGSWQASAGLYNVFDASYADPGSEEHRQDAIRQNGRSFALKLAWKF